MRFLLIGHVVERVFAIGYRPAAGDHPAIEILGVLEADGDHPTVAVVTMGLAADGGGADVVVDWMPSALATREKGSAVVNIAQPFAK